MIMNSFGVGGEISEIDRFCEPLKEVAGTRELMGTDDDSEGAAWVSAWRDLSNHLERWPRPTLGAICTLVLRACGALTEPPRL